MEHMDLALRVEWLEQALAAVPDEGALARLRSLVRGLQEIHEATSRIEARSQMVDDFLARVHAWCGHIASDLERMAGTLRRGQPTSILFSRHAIDRSYARFAELMDRLQRNAHDDLDELFWATEWLHVSLGHLSGD